MDWFVCASAPTAAADEAAAAPGSGA